MDSDVVLEKVFWEEESFGEWMEVIFWSLSTFR
jgi:hypothetical protein